MKPTTQKFFAELEKLKSKKYEFGAVDDLVSEADTMFETIVTEFEQFRDEYSSLNEQIIQKGSEIEQWMVDTRNKADVIAEEKNDLGREIEALGIDPMSVNSYATLVNDYIHWIYGRLEDATYYKEQFK